MKVKDMIKILQECNPESDLVVSAPECNYNPFTIENFYYPESRKRKIGFLTEIIDRAVVLECVEPEKVDPFLLHDRYHPTEKIWKKTIDKHGVFKENIEYFVDRGECKESYSVEDRTFRLQSSNRT